MTTDDGMETCQRCGEREYDRRTLWMACFYEMNELGLPFELVDLNTLADSDVTETKKEEPFSSTSYKDGRAETTHGTYTATYYHGKSEAKVQKRRLYTLRVCKDCRGDWMGAIKTWFQSSAPKEESCGSGIYVRRNGSTVEITEEEWNRLNPGREPVRWNSNHA